MAAIELLLERNRKAQRAFTGASWPKLCILTCDDAGLTGQLEQVLGLQAGDAVILRLPAGGGALSTEVVQRAVAKAVYVDGCDEVLVLSHSSCSLYNLSASSLIESLARHGVSRSAVPMDLRELVGAGQDPREAVRMSVEALRRCAYLPEAFLVHLGHLEESSGELLLVEHGEKYRVARGQAQSAGGVGGYQSGPTQLTDPRVQELPSIGDMTVQQLSAPSLPEVLPYERQAISVTMPTVTTQLSVPDDLTSAASHTAQSLHGGDSTANMFSPSMTSESLFASPPAHEQKPPALTRSRLGGKQSRKANAQSQMPALKPALADAVQKIRTFMGNEISKPDRREAEAQITEGLKEGASSEELVKRALRPVLQSGQNRYKVIDEMILVKEELVRLPPFQAAAVLRQMVP